jgi:glycosyltransferase involved in cell wall biosynthesis
MGLISQLSKLKNIPMVVHMMDDWPAVTYRQGILGPLVRPFIRRQLDKVFRQAAVRMGICDEMCEAYGHRYGYEFLSFQNALDVERWTPYRRAQWKVNVPFIVRYVGSIIANAQQESLLDVCRAVQELALAGEHIEMWVHTPESDSRYLRAAGLPFTSVRLKGPPSDDHIAELLSMSDLLVLPYNFDERSIRYIKLSMPTKAPAYMISAVPVLVYAPKVVATAKYAANEGWGSVVSIQGVRHVREEIYRLMKDEEARRRYGERAHQLACERHNAASIRPAFWKRLMEAAPLSPSEH